MPQNPSMKKRMRQLAKRTLRNRSYRSRMKTAMRAVREAIQSREGDAQAKFRVAQSAIDKAAKVGAIHHRKAARTKARLAKVLNST